MFHLVDDLAHDFDGTGRAGHDARPERAEIEFFKELVLQHGDEHGGHAVEGGAALLLHRGHDRHRVEGFQQHHGGGVGDGRQNPQHAAEAVEERHRDADPVFVREVLVLADPVAVGADIVMGQHDALGKPGGARGVLHVDHVVGVEAFLAGPVGTLIDHDVEGHDFGDGITCPGASRGREMRPASGGGRPRSSGNRAPGF